MSATDYLKTARDESYKPSSTRTQKDDDSSDPDEPNNTSRIIKLSDDEQKQFSNAKPGEELKCIVRGNLEEDGHFHVMSVSAPEGESYGSPEEQMAKKVAQGVQPSLMS